MYKNGKYRTSFSHVYSDHKIFLQGWRCSTIHCKWSETPSIEKRLSGKVHVDIVKLQAEFGSRNSYRNAAKALSSLTGNKRSINNKSRIHKTTNTIGTILENINIPLPESQGASEHVIEPAKRLNLAVDGGHVHDASNKGHNFEVMIGKVYRPENVVKVDKHHNEITKKHCAGSAKYDEQATMKLNVIEAAKKEGLDKDVTEVTVLADGARNCWNIAEALKNYCCVLLFILDWFHIGKYVENLKKQLPTEYEITLKQAKEQLWFGEVNAALTILSQFCSTLQSEEHIKKIEKFSTYIKENEEHIINYHQRKSAGLVYTSHVAESSVEHLLNARSKRKQKMQWSRDGLHAVIQIRSSITSNEWGNDWNNIILPKLKLAA